MKIPLSLALAFAVLAIHVSALAADWPRWRGPDYDGISRETFPTASELPETLPILWKAKVGIGFSTVSVQGDRVLTMGNADDRDTIWCLDAESGEVLWSHSYGCALDPLYYEGGPSSTPTIADGSVYTLSKKGHVFRLDLESGEVIWQRDLLTDHDLELPEWSFASSPFIDGQRVLLNVGRNGIALDKETGETLWLPSKETSGYATVVPFQNYHLLFSAKSLQGFDASSGETRWDFPSKSSRDVNAADPLVAGDRIVLSSSSGTSLLDPSGDEVREIWKQHDLK